MDQFVTKEQSKHSIMLNSTALTNYQSLDSAQNRSNAHSQMDELYYEDYLRSNYPELYDNALIKESPKQSSPSKVFKIQFQNHFKTSAVRIKSDRERTYLRSRERVKRYRDQKIHQLNNYSQVKGELNEFLQDHGWKWIKGRPHGYDFSDKQRETIFDGRKSLSNDEKERRFNNFNTKNFETKIKVPLIDKYSARKPLLNNMDTPLVYYDHIGEVYEKITFGETMQKCLFDYAKSARKEKSVLDLKAQLTVEKKQPEKKLSRSQVVEIVKRQEIIDHNIERMRNRLAINKAYPTPLFDKYQPRSRPSSHQYRWVKSNQNFYDDLIKQDERDIQRIQKNKENNKKLNPSSWRLKAKSVNSPSTSPVRFKSVDID